MKKTCISLLMSAMLFSLHADSPSITLTITGGSEYAHRKWFGPVPVKLTPQIAVWLEDSRGGFVKTLYLTGVSAENSWKGAGERPEALPVYSAKKTVSEDIDAISGASVKSGSVIRPVELPLGRQPFIVKAEVNSSFDYNEVYTKDNSGVNGQPSVIYEGFWSGNETVVSLEPAGRGSVSGGDGEIREDLSGLTTALHRIDSIILKQ